MRCTGCNRARRYPGSTYSEVIRRDGACEYIPSLTLDEFCVASLLAGEGRLLRGFSEFKLIREGAPMDTHLGQDLADAGFPRKAQYLAQTFIDPTLTELVDQCIALSPNGLFSLERRIDGSWSASSRTNMNGCGYGNTAEDAAAALWLVLRTNARRSRLTQQDAHAS